MPRKHKCKTCGDYFPHESMIKVPAGKFCCHSHLMDFVRAPGQIQKARKVKNREQKKAFYLKDLPFQLRETQKRFNELILLLDQNRPCISCGKHKAVNHAGHYKSVGSHPHMRFWAFNVHLQCAGCNLKVKHRKQAEATMEQNYRDGLIDRYGLSYVEAIEKPWPMTNPTASDLVSFKGMIASEKRLIIAGEQPEIDWRKIPSEESKPWNHWNRSGSE